MSRPNQWTTRRIIIPENPNGERGKRKKGRSWAEHGEKQGLNKEERNNGETARPHSSRTKKGRHTRRNPKRKSRTSPYMYTKPTGCTKLHVSANGLSN
jgi:hypothetical protein